MNDKTSYALGLSIANQFIGTGIRHLDVDDFAQAIRDVYEGHTPQLSYEESKEVVEMLFHRIAKEELALNLEAGREYQRILKEKNGVTTLENGIQYEILKAAEGVKPTPKSTVTVHYHGTLIDGTVFDSSKERGKPATFPLQSVIKGWQEILPLMPLGSTWRVVIPPELAYGERGAGGAIRPNMTLIFEIELLEIK